MSTTSPLPLIRVIACLLCAFVLVGCQAPSFAGARHVSQKRTVASLEQLPEPCLKQIYIDCSRAASAGHLSFGTVATCSLVYETLLQRHFDGDFLRLLAWSRQHPDDAPAVGFDESTCPPPGADASPQKRTDPSLPQDRQ